MTSPNNKESFPTGIGYAFAFQCFNTLSFSIISGAPLLTYFKSLGASATILGIVGSIPAFLVICQIPAARYLEQIGYRAFVVKGWSFRTFSILGIATIPFLPDSVSNHQRIIILLVILFIYNLARGISSCGFLPWMTQLIPESKRGRYISIDMICITACSTFTLILCGMLLGSDSDNKQFGIAFSFSFIAAIFSLLMLKRIPDVPVSHSNSPEAIPWKAMLRHAPFLRLLFFNIFCQMAFAGGGIFWIPLLRDQFGYSSSDIMYWASWSTGASLVSTWVAGKLVERTGSLPLIWTGLTLLIIHLSLWACAAAKFISFTLVFIVILQLSAAFGGPFFNVANTRLLMNTVPSMGRNHFFALFSVSTNLILGTMPIAWGYCIDSLAHWSNDTTAWHWNNYSLVYILLSSIFLLSMLLLSQIKEDNAMSTKKFIEELFVRTPSRVFVRLFNRSLLDQ